MNSESRSQALQVLVVDDEPVARRLLSNLLEREGCQVVAVLSGTEALAHLEEQCPDVVILDIGLPDLNGFTVCEQIRRHGACAEVPVLMVTALEDQDSRRRGFEVGADDFISKPFDTLEMKMRIRAIARLDRYRKLSQARLELEQRNRELLAAYDGAIQGWSKALDMRDHETEGHSIRVASLSVALGRRLGLDLGELQFLRWGALLHDIGKLGVPDAILRKPGSLTEAEWEIMRQHPTYGRDFLMTLDYLKPALAVPYCHHERWDGQGYPQGLAGIEIPLAARIFAVVDIWDALCFDRPYRAALPMEEVRTYLTTLAGHHLDPDVTAAFLAMSADWTSPAPEELLLKTSDGMLSPELALESEVRSASRCPAVRSSVASA